MKTRGSTYAHESRDHDVHQHYPVEIPIKYRKTWRKKIKEGVRIWSFVFEGYDLTNIRLSFGFDVSTGNMLLSIISTDSHTELLYKCTVVK